METSKRKVAKQNMFYTELLQRNLCEYVTTYVRNQIRSGKINGSDSINVTSHIALVLLVNNMVILKDIDCLMMELAFKRAKEHAQAMIKKELSDEELYGIKKYQRKKYTRKVQSQSNENVPELKDNNTEVLDESANALWKKMLNDVNKNK